MALILEIKVVPNSGKQQWILDASGALKCYLKSPPEKGLANQELITLLSKALKTLPGTIFIVAGATGRRKLVRINKVITFEQVLRALDIPQQLLIGG